MNHENEAAGRLEIIRRIMTCEVLTRSLDGQATEKFNNVEKRFVAASQNRTFKIVFCGVFSSGKSSLINLLLKMDDDYKLPVGVNPVTKLVTRIRYGKIPTASYRSNGQLVVLSPTETSAHIKGEGQIQVDNNEITISIPSEFLKNGIEILDTPGFEDEMGGSLEERSRNAILDADMAVMCSNAVQLGDIFERELISELNATMGHFSLVISRMDNMNTIADCEAVIEKAKWLMKNKGNRSGAFTADEQLFFPIIAAGPYQNAKSPYQTLDSFLSYLNALSQDGTARNKIQRETDRLVFLQCLQEASTALDSSILKLCDTIAQLTKENQKRIDRMTHEAQMEKVRFQNTVSSAKAMGNAYITEAIEAYKTGISQFHEPDTFVQSAGDLAVLVTSDLIRSIAEYGERNGIQGSEETKALLVDELKKHNFSIPAPQRHPVKKRGLVGRAVFTAINFAFLSFVIDDGVEYEYADYHTPAILAVQTGPISWIYDKWESYLQERLDSIKTSGFSGGLTDTISEAVCEVDELSKLKKLVESKRSIIQGTAQNTHEDSNADMLNIYGRETLPNIIKAVIIHINDRLPASGKFNSFILSFTPSGRKNYKNFHLLFEPDLVDVTHQNIRMFVSVPLKWNSDYEIKRELVKGKKEEVVSYLKSPACLKDIMGAIVDLDESERHYGP